MNMDSECPACASRDVLSEFAVREMMIGLRKEFVYQQCKNCQTLRLKSVPEDLSEYYPTESYYSLQPSVRKVRSPLSLMRRIRTSIDLGDVPLAAGLRRKREQLPIELYWIQRCGCHLSSRVLDVGCGNGEFLAALAALGLRRLDGVDPFLSRETPQHDCIRLGRKNFLDVQKKYDLLTFHHSLEHMASPRMVLQHAKSLLSESGSILIRTPCSASWAFEHYREHWVQIDAPRHVQVFSLDGLKALAERAKLAVTYVEFDSTDFGLWASEQYRNDIPLHSSESLFTSVSKSEFTAERLHEMKAQARELNASGRGDQVFVCLKHSAA